MRAVLQRVTKASVEIDGLVVGQIGLGLLVLLGVAKGDGEQDAQYVADKIHSLRIFGDEAGKMNRSVMDIQGAVLLISQFTLIGDTAKGRRPDFGNAAAPEEARASYEQVETALRSKGVPVETGRFGAYMKVDLVNDGPVTLLVDSRRTGRFAPDAQV
ncbi:MAG TPA: D-aminoacyl-tRNA deacylase [Nitrospiraceae bacterium]|nr:D-aminoacyl-tRNA deacylase [Nitrospiraceae bacterium]